MPFAAPTEGTKQPRIVRGYVDSLSIYEITDYELETLEQGSPNSLYLNFSIFFLSIAGSFLTALLTVPVQNTYVFIVFVLFTIVGVAAGLVLLLLWYKTRSRIKDLVCKIKARVPIAAVQPDTPAPTTPGQTEASAR